MEINKKLVVYFIQNAGDKESLGFFFRFGNMIYICPNNEITKEWNSSLNTKFFNISCANSLHVNYVIFYCAFALILAHHTGSNLEFFHYWHCVGTQNFLIFVVTGNSYFHFYLA